MTGHKVYARHSGVKKDDMLSVGLIKRVVRETLRLEGVDKPCEVSVLITNERKIRGINREFRGQDAPTDVLSFPMLELSKPGWSDPGEGAVDPGTCLIPLGEIVLSAERVVIQAREYMQTRERETAYLTVHSVLHLLGYDHVDEASGKRRMREREKLIMETIG